MNTETPSRASYSWQIFPADSAAAQVRATARKCLEDWGVDDSVADDAVLIADELYTNALQHSKTGPGEEITVELHLRGLALSVSATDGDRLLPSRKNPNEESESGRGLMLVEALSVAWGTERAANGKRVWAILPALATASTLAPS